MQASVACYTTGLEQHTVQNLLAHMAHQHRQPVAPQCICWQTLHTGWQHSTIRSVLTALLCFNWLCCLCRTSDRHMGLSQTMWAGNHVQHTDRNTHVQLGPPLLSSSRETTCTSPCICAARSRAFCILLQMTYLRLHALRCADHRGSVKLC